MSDYQRKKTKYILGQTLYNKTIWRIRDYYRLKTEADDLIQQSKNINGEPTKTNKVTDTIADIVAKRERYIKEINTIDKCLERIPKEYRVGVWDNITKGYPYPRYADRTTYGRWKSKFIYEVAMEFEKGD